MHAGLCAQAGHRDGAMEGQRIDDGVAAFDAPREHVVVRDMAGLAAEFGHGAQADGVLVGNQH